MIAARAVDAVFVAATPDRPRTAAAARASAEALLAALPEPLAMLPSRAQWVDSVLHEHALSIDRELARERSLLQKPRAHSEIQAGLFDRRAVAAAERSADLETRVNAEHSRRIEALLRERAPNVVVRPVAVLIVWR